MTNEIALSRDDFSKFKLVVGGGPGRLLSTILLREPHARRIVYDLPSVVTDADTTFKAAVVDPGGLAGLTRCAGEYHTIGHGGGGSTKPVDSAIICTARH